MTIYGQNWGDFKRENNECIVTGARKKLHKIKIVVFSSNVFENLLLQGPASHSENF